MCWVMPPASPLTTLVLRMASSSEVLPWSTWPMMVTTGGRGSRYSSASVWPMKPSSTSASDTRLGVWPNSVTISSAVSASITSLILCISPCAISSLMTSTDRSVMRLASSWMVITSGMITSRITLSRGSCTPAWRSFSRSRLRRREASERSRWASSKALLMVSLIRSRLSSATLTGLLTGLAPFFLLRASSSTSGSISAARPVRRATCSGRRITSPTFAFSGPAGLASPSFFGGSSTLPTSALATTAGSCSVVAAGAGSGLGSTLGRSASRRARSRSAASARSRSASSARRRASSSSVERPLVLGCAGCATSATVPRSGDLHRVQDLAVLRLAGRRQLARLLLLDDHRLRAAVAEALADVAGFDRPLQAQRLASAAPERLISGFLRL